MGSLKKQAVGGGGLRTLPCMCANLRRAARAVTELYDEALRPSGLRVTQFTLLQTLHTAPGISQKMLAKVLGLDSTTLTRTLAGLREQGWLNAEEGEDRRKLRLSLTAAGVAEFRRVMPYWQKAQRRLRRELGDDWDRVESAAVRVAELALEGD